MANVAAITPRMIGEVSWDPSSAATTVQNTDTVTINGLTTDMTVVLNIPAMTTGLVISHWWVSASNTLSIKFYNPTGGTVDGAAVTVKYIAF